MSLMPVWSWWAQSLLESL